MAFFSFLMATYGAVPQDEHSSDVERQQATLQRKDRAEWRVQLGEWIENEKVHWTVLLLVIVDATCVLFQIIYTLLHECQADRRPTRWVIELVEAAEITSMVITCLFVLELTIALVAFGPRYCLPPTDHWKLHILDIVGKFTLYLTIVFPYLIVIIPNSRLRNIHFRYCITWQGTRSSRVCTVQEAFEHIKHEFAKRMTIDFWLFSVSGELSAS